MRCQSCERSWAASARFCGRCGGRLGPGPTDERPARGADPGTDARRSFRRIVGGIVVVLAIGALALTGVPTFLDGMNGPQAVRGDVSVPTADPGAEVVRAPDRPRRPADCSDELQDLPRPVRHYGLYTGRLEWRDGRLCAPRQPGDTESDPGPDLEPRCGPPEVRCTLP